MSHQPHLTPQEERVVAVVVVCERSRYAAYECAHGCTLALLIHDIVAENGRLSLVSIQSL